MTWLGPPATSLSLLPSIGALLLAAACVSPRTAEAESSDGVRIAVPTQRLTATDLFQWVFPIRIANDLDTGIYSDSLICILEDLDPGKTGAPKTERVSLSKFTRVISSISRRDSAMIRYQGKALAEHARMTFQLKAHDTDGRTLTAETTMEIHPGPTSVRFPSASFQEKGRSIEYVFIPEVWPKEPSPGILLVHGEKSHARRLLPLGWELSNLGYAVMLVSVPGYGLSGGEPDFAGPATIRALSRAMDLLRRNPLVDSTRVAVWGISRGATAAALLAAERKDLKALVLESGIYDLASAYEQTRSDELKRAIVAEAGKGGSAWKRRSPMLAARQMTAPVLLLHGEEDEFAPRSQADGLARVLRVESRDLTFEMTPGVGHTLPEELRKRSFDFLKERLDPSK